MIPRIDRGARSGIAIVALVLVSSCSSAGSTAGDGDRTSRRPIVVGSYNFSESEILADVYAAALRRNGFSVRRLADVATCEIMHPALQQGQIDLVPEYLGSSLNCLTHGAVEASPNPRRAHAQLEATFKARGVKVLERASAQDQNAIVVTEETARRYDLDSISDLAAVAPALSFGGPPECPSRPLCLQGLDLVYGIQFKSFAALDASGPLTLGALERGEIDVALLFSTHPALSTHDLVVLRDDGKLQPPENIVPVIRSSVARAYGPRLAAAINRVTARITTRALIGMNEQVDVLGESPSDVAKQWLDKDVVTP